MDFKGVVYNRCRKELSLSLAIRVEEKSVILLKYYYEYSFPEMSEILKRPLGTVKSVLYRALKKLRDKAKEGHLDETDD